MYKRNEGEIYVGQYIVSYIATILYDRIARLGSEVIGKRWTNKAICSFNGTDIRMSHAKINLVLIQLIVMIFMAISFFDFLPFSPSIHISPVWL